MKAPTARHERVGSQSTICVVCLLGVLISAMSLGSLRLYGLYLEHRLASVTMRIESVNDKNAALEERYSSMLSPSRIYNFARSRLNMVTAEEITTIRVGEFQTGAVVAGLNSMSAGRAEYEYVEAPGIFEGLFTGVANAQD
jgi:hypothetical protein